VPTVPPMTHANMVGALKTLGWKCRNSAEIDRALRDFQRGYNLGDALVVDGKNGPRTRTAIRTSLARHKAGKPTASAHFSFTEFACRCGGRRAGCAIIRVHRELLESLEDYRSIAGPVAVVSGYRCPGHNAAVGGASSSQHVLGSACDVRPLLKTAAVARRRRFAGIGYQGDTGLVRHVDRRDCSGNNTTGGTLARPTTWKY
jgi:zinc D-Ala-D-Ala carboxypeptidase